MLLSSSCPLHPFPYYSHIPGHREALFQNPQSFEADASTLNKKNKTHNQENSTFPWKLFFKFLEERHFIIKQWVYFTSTGCDKRAACLALPARALLSQLQGSHPLPLFPPFLYRWNIFT